MGDLAGPRLDARSAMARDEAVRVASFCVVVSPGEMGGDACASQLDSEVIWRDPETRTEAERVDAVVKLRSIEVPLEACWSRIPGVTPQMVGRWRAMRDEDAVAAGLTLGVTPNGAGLDAPLISPPDDLAVMVQKLYLGVDKVISVEEARRIMNAAGAGLGPTPDSLVEPARE